MEVEERIEAKDEVEKAVHQLLFGDWKGVIKARRKDLPELLHRFLLLDQNLGSVDSLIFSQGWSS